MPYCCIRTCLSNQVVHDALQRATKGRTAVIVSHDLNTVRSAHQILVMDHGQVVERGNHAELMAAKGLYFRLHQLSHSRD